MNIEELELLRNTRLKEVKMLEDEMLLKYFENISTISAILVLNSKQEISNAAALNRIKNVIDL